MRLCAYILYVSVYVCVFVFDCVFLCACVFVQCIYTYVHVLYILASSSIYFTFSHPPVDKVTNDIKIPLYPARDVPYELLIKAFVGQKIRYIYM